MSELLMGGVVGDIGMEQDIFFVCEALWHVTGFQGSSVYWHLLP